MSLGGAAETRRRDESWPNAVNVYVTGASGFVGGHVARELREQGADVRDDWVDLLDADRLRRAVDGCDAVFHVAALYSFTRAGARARGASTSRARATWSRPAGARASRGSSRPAPARPAAPSPGGRRPRRTSRPRWELAVPYKRTKLEAERLGPRAPAPSASTRPRRSARAIAADPDRRDGRAASRAAGTARTRGSASTSSTCATSPAATCSRSSAAGRRALPARRRRPDAARGLHRGRRPRRPAAAARRGALRGDPRRRRARARQPERGDPRAHARVFLVGEGRARARLPAGAGRAGAGPSRHEAQCFLSFRESVPSPITRGRSAPRSACR